MTRSMLKALAEEVWRLCQNETRLNNELALNQILLDEVWPMLDEGLDEHGLEGFGVMSNGECYRILRSYDDGSGRDADGQSVMPEDDEISRVN